MVMLVVIHSLLVIHLNSLLFYYFLVFKRQLLNKMRKQQNFKFSVTFSNEMVYLLKESLLLKENLVNR